METSFAQSAQRLLGEQVTLTDKLVHLLQDEYEVLKHRDAGNLDDITQQKQQLVEMLEIANHQWQDALHKSHIKITLAEISEGLRQCDPENKYDLLSAWEQLAQLAKECQRQNMVNGAILVLRQQATQQTLDILRGKLPGEDTYGPAGHTKNGGDSKSLAKA